MGPNLSALKLETYVAYIKAWYMRAKPTFYNWRALFLYYSIALKVVIPYSENLLREEIFANQAIMLLEEIFAIFEFNY